MDGLDLQGVQVVPAFAALVALAAERETPTGLTASWGNGMGWSQMLSALEAGVEQGINLRNGAYR